MRVELHPDADGEFADQVDYYESKEAGLGQRFYREVIGYQLADWERRGLHAGQPRHNAP